jgi:hypothetical protein
MLRPRFSLRTLFVLVTNIGVAAGWVAYQLNRIRERHAFVDAHLMEPIWFTAQTAPWQLRLFGERGYDEYQVFFVDERYFQQAKDLFPEVQKFQIVTTLTNK